MSGLIVFESAARHGSFTHAARELFVTESAISRQVASLESKLGVLLFARSRQRVVLTRAGKLYSTQVRRALESLNHDTLSIIAHGSGAQYLQLAVLPTFASEWLIPKIKDFYESGANVRVNMGVRTGIFSIEEAHFDAAIHYGKPTWPRTSADYLFGEEVVPVCSKKLLKSPIPDPIALLDYPLLHSTTRPDGWANWFAALNIEHEATMQGVRYELHTMALSAAAAGLGIALLPRFLIADRLAAMDLTIPYQAPVTVDAAYYLVYPTELAHSKPLSLFRDWLLAQARAFSEASSKTPIQDK